MVWLPDGEKISKICLFVSTEYTHMTEGHRRRRLHSIMWQQRVLHTAATRWATEPYTHAARSSHFYHVLLQLHWLWHDDLWAAVNLWWQFHDNIWHCFSVILPTMLQRSH